MRSYCSRLAHDCQGTDPDAVNPCLLLDRVPVTIESGVLPFCAEFSCEKPVVSMRPRAGGFRWRASGSRAGPRCGANCQVQTTQRPFHHLRRFAR
jgi:hypothetical protein